MPSIKNLGDAFRRAASELGPGEFSLSGRSIRCPHCDGSQFNAGEAQLNTALATFFKLDWTDESATILICTTCGQIQLFGRRPSRLP